MLLCKSAAGTSSSVEDASSCKGSDSSARAHTSRPRALRPSCEGDRSPAELELLFFPSSRQTAHPQLAGPGLQLASPARLPNSSTLLLHLAARPTPAPPARLPPVPEVSLCFIPPNASTKHRDMIFPSSRSSITLYSPIIWIGTTFPHSYSTTFPPNMLLTTQFADPGSCRARW